MEFDEDTQVTPAPGGGYDAVVASRWDGTAGVPNGGHVATLALRALAELSPLPDPVTVSAMYLRPGRHGPAHVDAQILKAGRRIVFGAASLTQDGKAVLSLQAGFADLDRADVPPLAYERVGPPDLPPPDECVDPLAVHPDTTGHAARSVLGRVDMRFAELPGWLSGRPRLDPSMRLWLRMRDGREPDPMAMVQFADGMPPVVADLATWSTTVELTVHVRARPKPGWLRARVDTRHVGQGFHEEEVELWDEGGTLVAQSRQLALVVPHEGVTR